MTAGFSFVSTGRLLVNRCWSPTAIGEEGSLLRTQCTSSLDGCTSKKQRRDSQRGVASTLLVCSLLMHTTSCQRHDQQTWPLPKLLMNSGKLGCTWNGSGQWKMRKTSSNLMCWTLTRKEIRWIWHCDWFTSLPKPRKPGGSWLRTWFWIPSCRLWNSKQLLHPSNWADSPHYGREFHNSLMAKSIANVDMPPPAKQQQKLKWWLRANCYTALNRLLFHLRHRPWRYLLSDTDYSMRYNRQAQ